jgi:hypothetical protein
MGLRLIACPPFYAGGRHSFPHSAVTAASSASKPFFPALGHERRHAIAHEI